MDKKVFSKDQDISPPNNDRKNDLDLIFDFNKTKEIGSGKFLINKLINFF